MSSNTTYRKKILGYSNKLTVRPSESIEFKISSEENSAYDAQLVRLINGVRSSDETEYKEIEIESNINGRYTGRHQPIFSGSCVIMNDIEAFDALNEFTLAFFFMPTTSTQGKQHLISRWDETEQCGWSVYLNDKGQLAFTTAESREKVSAVNLQSQPLKDKVWYQATVRVSWAAQTVQLDCTQVVTTPHEVADLMGSETGKGIGQLPERYCPLMMAAAYGGLDISERPIPVACFNGRIEAPVVYQGLLTDTELFSVVNGVRPKALDCRLLADWDFSEDISTTQIKDRSANQLNGFTHNLPLRAVKGVYWDGSEMNWQHAPGHYGAIHFHNDDLYDCGWQTDISFQLPDNLQSGIYALRLRLDEGENIAVREEYIPFFVAARKNKPQAKLAFLVPTFTYLAYANGQGFKKEILNLIEKHLGEVFIPKEGDRESINMLSGNEHALLKKQHLDLGLSVYDFHNDNSPVHFSSWLRPILNVRPKSILWTLCADLLFIDWLEAKSFDYDIITDDLLQQEGVSLLRNYKVVMSGNHPEYPTTEQLDAISAYTREGGRFMYMGGNGYYWRAAVCKTLPGVIELRRGHTGTGTWRSEIGECYLSFTGEQGGLWKELGRPPQQQFGVGFIGEGFARASHYRITPQAREGRAAFILEGVDDDIIGDFGILGGGAAGQEIDKTNSEHGTPSHTIVLARSENHGSTMLIASEEVDSFPVLDIYHAQICAEVAFFETANGGAVFTVGSMAWCGSLNHNNYHNNISTITANVIHRFIDPEPFVMEAPEFN